MSHHQPVLILAGAYGVGKSEVTLNLAMHERQTGKTVTLGDLDVVNVYFRSRERFQLLEDAGIQVISSKMGHITTQDLPSVSGALKAPLMDKSRLVIIDAGGEQAGIRPLALFKENLEDRAELLIVLNHLRPENKDVPTILKLITRIEAQSQLRTAGLIANSHLLKETTAEDIMEGLVIAEEVSEILGVPIRWICGLEGALQNLPDTVDVPQLTIHHYLRSDWMS